MPRSLASIIRQGLFLGAPWCGFMPTGVLAQSTDLQFIATDSVTVFATTYPAGTRSRGVILAFHQGGANGRSEYQAIVPRLNAEGFTVLAVDLRSGGTRFGGSNRTVEALGHSAEFCDASRDLAGAYRFARERWPDLPLILWGSSFSGALVLLLAADMPNGIGAVVAFSPASGGPMAACRGEDRSGGITVPTLIVRPGSEMTNPAVVEQMDRFRSQGHRTHVADPGTHGSSTLDSERAGGDVEGTWTVVLRLLSDARR